MLPTVDMWLTLGSGHYLTALLGDPGLEGRPVQKHLHPHPWDQHLLLQYPGPHWEGQDRAGQWMGVCGPPTALGALAGLTARRHRPWALGTSRTFLLFTALIVKDNN
jgi:hypothetical protein